MKDAWSEQDLVDISRVALAFITAHHLDRVSTAQSLWFVVTTALWVMAPPLVYAWLPLWIGMPVGLLLSLRALHCLSQVTHMGVHGILFRNRRLSAVVGDLAAYLLGYSQYIRKQTHLQHHLALNTPDDPDRTWGGPDQRPGQFAKGLVCDLLGLSILQKMVQYYAVERRRFSLAFEVRGILKVLLGLVSMQALLVAYYVHVAGIPAYVFLFLVPMATIYPATIRLRSFAEHSLEDSLSEGWMARTVTPSLFERFVMAPGHQSFHFEHHLCPGVPLYYLPQLHAHLVSCGAIADDPRGYGAYALSRV